MKRYVLAHDLGTTGNKATLYDGEGRMVGSAFHGYGTEFAHTGWAEQNPEDWWHAVCISTRKLLPGGASAGGRDRVHHLQRADDGLRAARQERASPLRNAIIWADQRAVDQERWLGERISLDDVYHITGHRLSASYSLCKMLWLRDHQPDVYVRPTNSSTPKTPSSPG